MLRKMEGGGGMGTRTGRVRAVLGRLAAAAVLLVLCAACAFGSAGSPEPGPGRSAPTLSAGADRLLSAQLGLLEDCLSDSERARAAALMERLYPLRQERLEQGGRVKSAEEERLVRQLNRLYERYTVKYMGDYSAWETYAAPAEEALAQYRVSDGALQGASGVSPRPGTDYGEANFLALWDQITGMLPEGACAAFSWFEVFTDGVDNTLAYVYMTDRQGEKWAIAVDPADAGDRDWFTATVLHEYCHYLTLNAKEAEYTERPPEGVYCEPGMASRPGSYLDDFYQAFWTDYLDDRLASPESFHFFLRHEEDFVTDYAATDPSEDIAECFTYFILWGKPAGDAVWKQKLRFFYDYPELVDFRAQTRARLGLEETGA